MIIQINNKFTASKLRRVDKNDNETTKSRNLTNSRTCKYINQT